LPAASVAAPCPCDCNDDGTIAINELVTALDVAFGSVPLSECSSFPECGGDAVCPAIVSLVQCVNAALSGCPVAPTPSLVPGWARLSPLLESCPSDTCPSVVTTPGGRLAVTAGDDTGTVRCSSFIGHEGSVSLSRYASASAAAAAFADAAPGEEVS